LYWHFPHYTNQGGQPAGAVREGDWKLIEHYEDGRLELFNLAQDIGETNNLVETEKRRAARMAGLLAGWRVGMGAQTNTVNRNFDSAAHQTLYLHFDASRFHPAEATSADWQRALAWRCQMDAATTP
jgi:arylsulfatase A